MENLNDLRSARESLWQELASRPSGLGWCDRWTEVADKQVRRILARVEQSFPSLDSMAIIAVGGYGRRELSPYSDIDLCLVAQDESHPDLDPAARMISRLLTESFSDGLGIKVDYALRFPSDVAGMDHITRAGFLDARLVAGSDQPLDHLLDEFWNSFPVAAFLIEKLEERARQYHRTHDTPLVVTPDLKEGCGGLRDAQCSSWICQAIGERARRHSSEYDTVLTLRNTLHLLREKKTDLLTHQAQAEVANRLNQDPRRMMREAHEAMQILHLQFEEAKERLKEARYRLSDGVTAIRGEARIAPGTKPSAAAFGIAHAVKLGLAIPAGPAAITDQVDGSQAVRALAQGERVIRAIDHSGVLQHLIPEFDQCRTLLPDDTSHQFTVFEHSLQAVRNLDSLREESEENRSSKYAEWYRQVNDRGVLYTAVVLHDIGKSDPSDRHEITGAKLCQDILSRWGLEKNRIENVVWLVRNHLELARILRIKDPNHPDTALELVQLVSSKERLFSLALLTWADSLAVGPGVWTQTQDAFLSTLLSNTLALLTVEGEVEINPENYRREARRALKNEAGSVEAIAAFIDSLPAYYLLSTPPERIPNHFQLAQIALKGSIACEFQAISEMGVTEMTVAVKDAPGLLSRILGLIYAEGLSLIAVRASTSRTEEPIALDVFTLSMEGEPVPAATCKSLMSKLKAHYANDAGVLDLLTSLGKDSEVALGELKITYHKGSPGILEIQGKRGRGLAYRISRQISQQNWNILGARVGQWAGRGSASFTISTPDGSDLSPEAVYDLFAPRV
jgi:[protein-PII] uridylyltransferase